MLGHFNRSFLLHELLVLEVIWRFLKWRNFLGIIRALSWLVLILRLQTKTLDPFVFCFGFLCHHVVFIFDGDLFRFLQLHKLNSPFLELPFRKLERFTVTWVANWQFHPDLLYALSYLWVDTVIKFLHLLLLWYHLLHLVATFLYRLRQWYWGWFKWFDWQSTDLNCYKAYLLIDVFLLLVRVVHNESKHRCGDVEMDCFQFSGQRFVRIRLKVQMPQQRELVFVVVLHLNSACNFVLMWEQLDLPNVSRCCELDCQGLRVIAEFTRAPTTQLELLR